MNQAEHSKTFTIIVNTREKVWSDKDISYEQLVVLAFGQLDENPNITYTITFTRGHGDKPEGSLTAGNGTKVKDGMVFDVHKTHRS
jgi:hypothetical protein